MRSKDRKGSAELFKSSMTGGSGFKWHVNVSALVVHFMKSMPVTGTFPTAPVTMSLKVVPLSQLSGTDDLF